MATTKKGTAKKALPWKMSWKNLFFSASVALNIASFIVLLTMIWTHTLDGMWMREGLMRYCDTANDEKFADNTETSKALRDFTCAKGDAADDFKAAFDAYMKTR